MVASLTKFAKFMERIKYKKLKFKINLKHPFFLFVKEIYFFLLFVN